MFERIVKAIDPDRLHLAARIAAEAVTFWAELRSEYEAVSWLETQGVEDLGVARKIAELLGAEASIVLRQNPYVLVGVLPWQTADKVALRILLRSGVRLDDVKVSPRRVVGAIDALMKDAVADGHTAVLKEGFCNKVRVKLGCHVADERIIELGIRNRAILDGDIVWRCPGCAFMEAELEARFVRMAGGEEPSRVRTRPEADLRRILAFVSQGSLELGSEQVNAAVRILKSDLACLTGGAGTGKTTTCRAVARAWEALGGRVELSALSGKAALRLAEGLGRTGPDHRPALTLQRLLIGLRKRAGGETHWGADPQEGQARPAAFQLPELTDQTLLILDEASMIDLGQIHALVEIMPRGCRLLFVGDSFQLPPIGVGLVFHRLVERLGTAVRLEVVRRQVSGDTTNCPPDAMRN
jgi:exodeoxyribonuclease V alpha subunit